MEAYDLYKKTNLNIDGNEEDISKIASWAIWAPPENENWSSKDSIGDMSVFDESNESDIRTLLNTNFIFVGLNPSYNGKDRSINPCSNCTRSNDCNEKRMIENRKFPSWHNFHSGCMKRSQDYKLRRVFYKNSLGERFKGSLIIDLLPNKEDQNAEDALKATTTEDIRAGLRRLTVIWKELGRKSVIVPMGRASFEQFKKHKDLIPKGMIIRGIRHFSARGYSTFETAITQLSEDDFKYPELIMYTGKGRR